jgi:hypothetical protein
LRMERNLDLQSVRREVSSRFEGMDGV